MLWIKTEYRGMLAEIARGRGVTTKWFRGVIKETYDDILNFWHKKIRPKHFERSAISDYAYTPRTKAYEQSKRKKLGTSRPLVYSGDSMRATERSRITTTGRSGSLSMDAGNLGWPTPGGRINMRAELTALNAKDRAAMTKVAEKSILKRLMHSSARFSQTIR